MICSGCGNQNTDGARFCNSCGVTLSGHDTQLDQETLITDDGPAVEAHQKDKMIGLSIDGRYRIDGLIGIGGMGTVYLATRVLIGDEVAIKILHSDRTDPHASERFRREAQAAARLKHPNAVSIYDFGVSTDGLQYLVMEFVEGESLREVTRRQGPLEFSLVAEITSQICAALDEAHRRHIIHRDIKPDNIILSSISSGLRVKVLDFGIAKLRDDTASHLTQTGSVMGTPHYMSPEQCLGEELDPRADIYSVGIVLYEMLCGRVPFNSPVSTAVVVQHVSQQPPSLRSINPAVPAALEAVALHALEKGRDARPGSAGELAQELTRALHEVNAPAVAFSGFRPLGMASLQEDLNLNEETVERRREAANLHSNQSLPKTVHLASPHLGVAAAGRPTEGSNAAAITASLKRNLRYKYLGISLAAVFVIGLIALVLWPSAKETNQNTTSANIATPAAGAVASNPSTPDSDKIRSTGTASPAGMVAVSGGQFLMGSSEGDPDARPAHMVLVKGFYLDVHEVTCEDYKRFVDETGRRVPRGWANGTYPEGTDKHPVTGVTWEDADAYARWAGKRLPTEQEWEYAARGKSGFHYPWGNSWRAGCANADQEGAARKRFANVGSYGCASPFGAQDLIGNAWEWTASDWVPYPGGRLANPTSRGDKVIRGGSWETPRNYATGTYRSGYQGDGDNTGFRCAKDMP